MPQDILKQTKLLCQTYGIRPARERGQNFLINPEVIKKIMAAAELKNTDRVLEAGPGLGILTEELVKTAGEVISVELDEKLFTFLKSKFFGAKNLELVNDDVLNLTSQWAGKLAGQYKITANLPYNITSHFLQEFLTAKNRPSEMTLLLQKEVAQRICAKAGEMSLLAISVQLYGEPELIEIVKKENFWPEPEVDSAILKISKIKTAKEVDEYLLGITEKEFWQILKIGFSNKRKQLQNNLAAGLNLSNEEIKKSLSKANFNPQIRAQDLALADWLKVAKLLNF